MADKILFTDRFKITKMVTGWLDEHHLPASPFNVVTALCVLDMFRDFVALHNNPIDCYRIVDLKDGKVKSLFHGTDGSRTLPFDKWIRANRKLVHDGPGGKYYIAGFHIFRTLGIAEAFFARRFRKKGGRAIIKCKASGLRQKMHSPSEVWLADELYIPQSTYCIMYGKVE
jgi:hypothetical protein